MKYPTYEINQKKLGDHRPENCEAKIFSEKGIDPMSAVRPIVRPIKLRHFVLIAAGEHVHFECAVESRQVSECFGNQRVVF